MSKATEKRHLFFKETCLAETTEAWQNGFTRHKGDAGTPGLNNSVVRLVRDLSSPAEARCGAEVPGCCLVRRSRSFRAFFVTAGCYFPDTDVLYRYYTDLRCVTS